MGEPPDTGPAQTSQPSQSPSLESFKFADADGPRAGRSSSPSPPAPRVLLAADESLSSSTHPARKDFPQEFKVPLQRAEASRRPTVNSAVAVCRRSRCGSARGRAKTDGKQAVNQAQEVEEDGS